MDNVDSRTVHGFGEEWSRFDQADLPRAEAEALFGQYFELFPWASLPPDAEGFDLGCGSGRWAKLVAPRVGTLHCIDASPSALAVAKRNLAGVHNVVFHHATVASIPLADNSMDYGYSLGVLHHTPDTAAGLASCVAKLRRGAPFLVYLYYAFDNRPTWFRMLWRISDIGRRAISRLPLEAKVRVTDFIAASVYFPLARAAGLIERAGVTVATFPLSMYRQRSFYVMRTDALDRFGTRLEHRFTAAQVEAMMVSAGLRDITISNQAPYWCAIGRKS